VTLPALTRKEATWLACKDKTCCYTSYVLPTGRDIWRIARALDTPPWTFAGYFDPPAPRPDAFQFQAGGPRYRLMLAKQPGWDQPPPAPCMFLLRTRRGHHRCGLGALRPLVCRSFPAALASGVLYLQQDGGCTCRTWSLPDVDIADEQALIAAREAEFSEYCAVVARWNAQVNAAPAPFDFMDYCDFLLAAYDALAAPPPDEVV
jgi:Fe-S-cluster containining protein